MTKPNKRPAPASPANLPAARTFTWETQHEPLIEQYHQQLGPTVQVLREMIPTGPRVDVYLLGPSDELPFHKLVTVGMSQVAMPAPKKFKDCTRAELIIGLPDEWPVTPDALAQDAHRWPIALLRRLARVPQAGEKPGTWLFAGHVVDCAATGPIAPGIKFTGAILIPPLLLPEEAQTFFNRDLEPIFLLGVVPLYAEELANALDTGDAESLLGALDEVEATEILDLDRPNTCEPNENPTA